MKKLLSVLLTALITVGMASNAYALNSSSASASGTVSGVTAAHHVSSGDLRRPKAVRLKPSGIRKMFMPRAYAAQTAVNDGSSNYGYSQLDTAGKQAYNLMKKAAQAKFIYTNSNPNVINLNGLNLTENDIYQIYGYFRNDNPQLFWLDWSYVTDDTGNADSNSSTTDGNAVVTDFGLMSFYDTDQIDAMKTEIDEAVNVYLDKIRNISDDYQKELTLHDMLVQNLSYNSDNPDLDDAHNLYGVFVSKTAVCEGYAKAFQYLLNLSGIPSIYVTGESEDEGHAWDLAEIGGKYYQVDSTWDDPSAGTIQRDLNYPMLSHAYFNVTTAQLENDHTIDTGLDLYPLPACDSTDENYFVKHGYILSSTNDFKNNAVTDSVGQINSGSYMIEIKTSSQQALDDISSLLSTDGYTATQAYKNYLSSINQQLPADLQIDGSEYNFIADDTSDLLTIFAVRSSSYCPSGSYTHTIYKTELAQNIIYAENSYSSGDEYTAASYAALTSALQKANTVNTNTIATQTATDSAAHALLAAINALELQSKPDIGSSAAPVITISSYNTQPTNADITVTASTDKGTLNATSHTFTQNGSFDFIATAPDGTTATKTVTITNIDKTLPTIASSVASGAFTNSNVTVTVSDNVAVAGKTAKRNSVTISWPSNNTFTQNGSYIVTATDTAGNISKMSFTIDKSAPQIYASVGNGKCTRISVQMIIVDNTGISSVSETLNGSPVTYNSRKGYSAEGSYSFTAMDKAGNRSTYLFTIDKTAPVITTSAVSGGVAVSVTDVNLATQTVYLNGSHIAWPSGNVFTSAGIYTVYAADKAGNSSIKTFTVGNISSSAYLRYRHAFGQKAPRVLTVSATGAMQIASQVLHILSGLL